MYCKNKPGFALIVAFFAFFQHSAAQDLALNWEFRETGSNTWYPAVVPGSVYTDLFENGIIPDPLAACNEELVHWVAERDWEYRTLPFRVNPELLGTSRQLLNLQRIDGVCEVSLNGHKLTVIDNSFLQIASEINGYLRPEGNIIEMRFRSPWKVALEKADAYGFTPPGGARVFLRSPQYQWGWDWAPALPPIGIGANPEILSFDTFLFRHFRVDTEFADNSSALMTAVFTLTSILSTTMEIELEFGQGQPIRKSMELKKGTHDYTLPFEVSTPKLWWPHDQGDPYLYDAKLRISASGQESRVHRKTGICTVELLREKDAKGEEFTFQINGRRIFARGSNYVPQDMFLSKVKDSDYLRLLSDVKESNMNMIRVWGGGVYEKERFYDLCDSLGILVWQDFMFACGMYPGDEKFLNNIWDEAIQNARRIGAHPSFALFCGNNEIAEGWARWGWKDGMKKGRKRKLEKAYKDIFERMLPLAVRYSGYKPYWESSPMLGRGDSLHRFKGDSHYWGVWHDAEPFEAFESKIPRFMSEFGFQSYPTRSTLAQISASEISDRQHPSLACHQKHPRGNELIETYMKRWMEVPADFRLYTHASQVVQAEGMKIGIEAHRQAKPFCMGSLYWQLNDCWPAVSWSGIDYSGSWKPLQHVVKRAFYPLSIQLYETGGKHIAGIVNDLPMEVKDTLVWRHQDYNGSIRAEGSIPVSLFPNRTAGYELNSLITVADSSREFIALSWKKCADCPDFTYHFMPPGKSYYSGNGVSWTTEKQNNRYLIRLSSDEFQRGLWLESTTAGKFSDNYIDLLPGEQRELFFTPFNPDDTPQFECLNLGGIFPISE